MERLTTNKNVSEMGMLELALNCCYITQDGNTRYRDYEKDIDARHFTRVITENFAKDVLPLKDESFDEEMMENLMYDPLTDINGLIAVFYRNMWAMAELREKLKRYEDAEEQGLLLRLPCKVGSNIYRITDDGVDVAECREICVADEEMYIESVTLCDWISFDEIGKTIFLTEAEAEAKLAEMEGI